MFLGIAIEGEKLQLGVSAGSGGPLEVSTEVLFQSESSIERNLEKLLPIAGELIETHGCRGIGVAFRGSVDSDGGTLLKCPRFEVWEGIAFQNWLEQHFHLPAKIRQACETAALAEANYGVGKGNNPVLYLSLGEELGGAFILDGKIYSGQGIGAMAIGHLRPGLQAIHAETNVAAVVSHLGIVETTRQRLSGQSAIQRLRPSEEGSSSNLSARKRNLDQAAKRLHLAAEELLQLCDFDLEKLSTTTILEAALSGNAFAVEILDHTREVLAWAIAQSITLLAPQNVILSGELLSLGEMGFLEPLRHEIARYVNPAFLGKYTVIGAPIRDNAALQGAILLAKQQHQESD
ncbi:Hypothetical protein PBC10988_13160 [Planctomycetales bacterium 10988]|nr:Hypothetical protein PBC10988_13160 [Planctomycetales bacterium 10988]